MACNLLLRLCTYLVSKHAVPATSAILVTTLPLCVLKARVITKQVFVFLQQKQPASATVEACVVAVLCSFSGSSTLHMAYMKESIAKASHMDAIYNFSRW